MLFLSLRIVLKFLVIQEKKTFNVVPGWNDSVKHAHSSAREAYSIWCHVNKPRNSTYFQ